MTPHVQEHLSAFMDGALSASEQAAVQEHLRLCSSCTRLLEELSVVDEAARALPVDAPAGYFDTFAGRVRRRLEDESRTPKARPMPRWTLALAAGLLLAVVTPLTVRQIQRPQPPSNDQPGLAGANRQKANGDHEPAMAPAQGSAGPAPSSGFAPAPPGQTAPTRLDSDASRLPKDDEAGPGLARSAQARPQPTTPRSEAAGKRSEGANPAETDDLKVQVAPKARVPASPRPQATPPVFQEEYQRDLADQAAPAPAAPPASGRPVAPPVTESREQPKKLEETRDQAGAEAEGKVVAPSARERRSAASAEQAAGSQGIGRARPSDTLAGAARSAESEFGRLQRQAILDLASARALREAWRSFALRYPESPRADEARVRTIAVGAEALSLGGDAADRELLEQDGAGYLQRDESKQKERVRAILRGARP